MADCESCIRGTIHKGDPIGVEEQVHGLNTYIVGNRTNPRAIIVIYPDAFGRNLINNFLIADAYAKSGDYLVYMPDFYEGDAASLSLADLAIPVDASKLSSFSKYTGLLMALPTFIMFLSRHGAAKSERVTNEFLAKLRKATPKEQKIGIVGFCFGGKYAMIAGLGRNKISLDGNESDKVPLVDAVVALHPSNLSLPADAEDIIVPLSIGWGKEDSSAKIELMGKVQELHKKAAAAGKQVPEVEHKVYVPGRHGFAVRGNPDDPAEKKCLEDSVTQVLDWFKKWL
ncbi:hypothetical protein BT63DRAFT_458342 [Microthyrium microscopicum]|uniref:Dienelactone hydrolase domain-containing protein n=1 Tax=Microthyrium microscopicum TaxID=703497 RepID=A0A6A6U237_9PEZI|nr:hypothetical protein BT63DRAFT_458342 [Microthyrium microscopicum]